jgi:predicted amidohydrolase
MAFPEFKLAMGQMLVECGEIEGNLKRAEGMISDASRRSCQLIVLPECSDLGWGDPSAHELTREIPGETSERLCRAASENGIMVVAGLTERDGSRIFNSAILIDRSGEILLKHRKINILIGVEDIYSVGNMLSVVETGLARWASISVRTIS